MPAAAPVLLIVGIGCLFYLVVPGLGAFQARHGWRRFRRRIGEAARMPLLRRPADAAAGRWRFLGTLEAVQGRNRLWLTGGEGLSVAADLEGAQTYILPWSAAGEAGSFGDEEPQILPWKSIASLPAGTQILVAGSLVDSGGRRVFRQADGEPPLVVLYEGDARTLLERAVLCGRQRNEYWTQLTRISLLTGFLALFLTGSLVVRSPELRAAAMLAYTLCAVPLAVFLPPGVVFYFLYRRLWRRARTLRAERDLFRLPLGYLEPAAPGAASLPGGDRYVMVSGSRAELQARLAAGALPEEWESSLPAAGGTATLFGAAVATGGGDSVGLPRDPMARLVLLPGDPEDLARRSASTARRDELLAAVLFAAGFLPNMAIIVYALRRIVF